MKYSTKIHGPVALAAAVSISTAIAGTVPGVLTFSMTPLLSPAGQSEPAISIGADGTLAVTGLQWLFDPASFGTLLWTGPFGSTPTFQGLLDANLPKTGKTVFGSGDADIDLGASGTLHATSLIFLLNPSFKNAQLGVVAVSCPKGSAGSFDLSRSTRTIIDTTGSDRPWISSEGQHVYISYHDAQNSSIIHVQRSDDDGQNWQRAGDPITGQGPATGDATFNNDQGPIVADFFTHNVYAIYAAGEPGIQKATVATFNNIFVSRSADLGRTWQSKRVFHAPLFTGPGQRAALRRLVGRAHGFLFDLHRSRPALVGGGDRQRCARLHGHFPVGGGLRREGRRGVLRYHRGRRRRSERGLERVSGANHQRRGQLHAKPRQQYPQPCWRDLHRRLRLPSSATDSA